MQEGLSFIYGAGAVMKLGEEKNLQVMDDGD